MRLILFSFCFLITVSCFGSGNFFVKGNQAFQAKDYAAAIDAYEIHLEQYTFSRFESFHNLGNAYYRVENYPKAILNYEKALLIQPNHKHLQHNLKIANTKIEDQFSEAAVFFLVKWWQNWRNLFSVNTWSFLTILMAIISAVALGFWKLGSSRKRRKTGFLVGFSTFALSFLLLITTWQRNENLKNPNTAIVMQTETELKTASDENSPTIFMLHSGTKIRLLDDLGNWQKVYLPNGDLGWLEKESFEQI